MFDKRLVRRHLWEFSLVFRDAICKRNEIEQINSGINIYKNSKILPTTPKGHHDIQAMIRLYRSACRAATKTYPAYCEHLSDVWTLHLRDRSGVASPRYKDFKIQRGDGNENVA